MRKDEIMLRRRILPMALLLVATVFATAPCQEADSATALLAELGDMLDSLSVTSRDCQPLLEEIRQWQQEKLEGLTQTEELLITSPHDGDTVVHRLTIEGRAANPEWDVWIVIHPMEVSSMWVQPRVAVGQDGTWRAIVFVGREGKDSGRPFEIRAFANPKGSLVEGMQLQDWPDAEFKSDLIYITRQ